MNRFAINTVGNELEESAAYCKSENLGIEYTDFAFPSILDTDLTDRIARHTKAVEGITPLISHGPFFDLIASSIDSAIVAVTKQRHDTALAATRKIGASIYVAHAGFMPLFRYPSYRKEWNKRMLDFWLPLADEAGKANMIICLENVWEPVPDIQAELITAGNHPHFQASLDVGHVLVFSNITPCEWVETLGPMLAHCHIHDNSGEWDQHKPVGEGIIKWKELTAAFKEHSPQAVLVMESDRLNDNKLSVNRLKNCWETC